MNNRWMDRAVTALITLLIGAGAQGLLSWREISVLQGALSAHVKVSEATDLEIVRRLDDVSQRQREVVTLLAETRERLEGTRDDLGEHKSMRQHISK